MNTTTAIGELALRLHQTGEPRLRLDLNSFEAPLDPQGDEEYTLSEGAIEFTSLAARNRFVASLVFTQLDAECSDFPRLLFAKAKELWLNEICNGDKASGRLLAKASERLDVIATLTQRIKEGDDLWKMLHLLEATVPHLAAINPDSLIDLCDTKFDKVKNNLAGGIVHDAIEQWYVARPQEAVQLHMRTLERLSTASASLLGNAILAIAWSDFQLATDLALQDAVSNDPIRSGAGVWAAGRLLLVQAAPQEQIARLQGAVLQEMQSGQGDTKGQAIRSAVGALVVTDAFDAVLKQLCVASDQEALSAVAEQLWLKNGHFVDRPDLPEWFELMPALQAPNNRAISDLDYALAEFVKRPELQPRVLTLLGRWVEQHGRGGGLDKLLADSFPSMTEAIGQHEELRCSLVTSWLLSDSMALPASLQHVLHKLPESQIVKLETEKVNELDQDGLVFLARRILGYLHDHVQMTSLVLSLLESKDHQMRIYPLLRVMLKDEIGYDYPSNTIKACQQAAQEKPKHREFLLQIAGLLEQEIAALADLPLAKELMPPMKLRRIFATARAKQMSEAFKEASKKSILRQIATEIPIKAGKGMFGYYDDTYTDPVQMKAVSHSIELPRREVFDPVGNTIRRLQFRIAKRGEK